MSDRLSLSDSIYWSLPSDVAARGNFCTLDERGLISDRRAGRIPTEQCAELCELLRGIELPGARALIEPVREHRFVLVLRGEGLSDDLAPLGTDPQREGLPPNPVEARTAEAEPTARLFNQWIAAANKLLADHHPANSLLVRGFANYPDLPSMQSRFGLNPAAIAIYPMYRGLAKLAGMKTLPSGSSFEDEIATLRRHWDEHDFFFIHYKKTDAAGEDGDFMRKVHALQEFDALLPRVLELKPDVLMIGGDHSTPAIMAAHSWHPVPFLLHAKLIRADATDAFNEPACQKGGLGTFPAREALPLALAHAGRFTKFGA